MNTNKTMKDVDTWKKSDIVRWCYQNIDSKKTGNDGVTDDETYFETILKKGKKLLVKKLHTHAQYVFVF